MTFTTPRMLRNALFATLAVSGLAVHSAQAQEIPYEVKVNYSLAAENFKNGDYESALPYLRWLMINAPTLYNGERIHKRAVRTYEELAGATEDETLKVAYLDTALSILETTVAKFQDAGVEIDVGAWELDYGNFLVAHRNELPGIEDEPVNHFIKAYEMNPAEMDPYYIRLIVTEYMRQERKQDAIDFMDEAEQHFQGNEELLAFFDEVRNQLFKSPEERDGFLQDQLAKAKTVGDSLTIVREQFKIAVALKWTDKMAERGALLLRLDPSVATYRQMAAMKTGNGDYRAALEMNRKALELADDPMVKRDILYEMALAYYDTGNLQEARSNARRAIGQDANFGNAYILIGDVLAKAVQESAFEREDKAVYWLALDYYERARSVDSSVASEANSRINRYRQYMPTKEEKFFKGWKEGDSYAIDYGRYAWINETTHVR